mmetsp:Transcript_35687/g.112144  ORF Transcript_35687/g.112144 Transcript_35687/m.112144 type:complete len:246 (-) Transcript_35687:242-979(-)
MPDTSVTETKTGPLRANLPPLRYRRLATSERRSFSSALASCLRSATGSSTLAFWRRRLARQRATLARRRSSLLMGTRERPGSSAVGPASPAGESSAVAAGSSARSAARLAKNAPSSSSSLTTLGDTGATAEAAAAGAEAPALSSESQDMLDTEMGGRFSTTRAGSTAANASASSSESKMQAMSSATWSAAAESTLLVASKENAPPHVSVYRSCALRQALPLRSWRSSRHPRAARESGEEGRCGAA